MPRRERWSVIGAILQAIHERHERDGADARVTNVATTANISYDRLMGYLDELAEAGLVTRDRMPRLTAKGEEFLRQYRQWVEVLDRFGIEK